MNSFFKYTVILLAGFSIKCSEVNNDHYLKSEVASDTTWQEPYRQRLRDNFNSDLNLWTDSKGKHHIRGSAKELLIAAELQMLDELPTDAILQAIRSNQVKDGHYRGNFKWNYEDEKARDTHSGFFTVLPLLVLHHEYKDMLTSSQNEQLMKIFHEARIWFIENEKQLNEKRLRYPNVMLSEVTALWLVSELTNSTDHHLEDLVAGTFRYYRESNWGWGEHLSDLYGMICQDALAIFLLCENKATPEMQTEAKTTLQELIDIDAKYHGGPFVPTVRCFAFDWSPRTPKGWNGWFRPFMEPGDNIGWGQNTIYRHMLKNGLDKEFKYIPAAKGEVNIDSYRPSKALAWVADNWRLGVFASYPLPTDMNKITHGLMWQSMPMAFWHTQGDWGYLQWQTEENGHILRAPHNTRGAKRGKYSRILSNEHPEAKIGQTFGTRHGKEFLVYRRLPAVAPSWKWAGDRFRLINPTHNEIDFQEKDGWSLWYIPFENEILTVGFISLSGDVSTKKVELAVGDTTVASEYMDYLEEENLHEGESGETTLEIQWDMRDKKMLGGVWYFTVGNKATHPPMLKEFGSDLFRATFHDGASCLISPESDIPWTNLTH